MTPLSSCLLTACLPALRSSTDHIFEGCTINWPCCALHAAVPRCLSCQCWIEQLACHHFHHFCALSVRTEPSWCYIRPQGISLWLCSADRVPHLAVHSCFVRSMLSELYKRHPKQILCCRQPRSLLWSKMWSKLSHSRNTIQKHDLCCRQSQVSQKGRLLTLICQNCTTVYTTALCFGQNGCQYHSAKGCHQ